MLDFNTVEDEIICPYCNYEFHDSWEYGDRDDVIICDNCEKSFHYSGELILKQQIAKDCELNDEEHDFQPYYNKLLKCVKCGSIKSI